MTIEASAGARTPVDLVTLTIDDVEVSVPKGTLLIRAAEVVGIEIPRFCDHPLLEPVGACRQCLVEITDAGNGRGFPKPQASCTVAVEAGMVVRTQRTSPVAEKAQRGNLEFLLINHPLDCPVCDKGGECPLQNQAMSHGPGESRFIETKRTFAKPIELSAQVLLDRERCVLCARCTRFGDEISGDSFIAMIERGAQQQVGIAPDQPFGSYFAGNTIQICPVGALTSADYRFRARPFDLVSTPSIAEHDACGAAIRVDHRRGRVMRRLAGDDPDVNEEWITDKDRFGFAWATAADRIRTPLVRDDHGELQVASWPAALAAAARGLSALAGSVGVVPGGRLTLEDAYAWSKFARVALQTNDVDFRSRAHGAQEAEFLAAHVAATGVGVTYRDLEEAGRVVLVGLDPEDEAGTLFLRLRKAVRTRGTEVITLASHLSRGSTKLAAGLVPTRPGEEAAALSGLELGPGDIVLAGERLGLVPGGLAAAVELTARTGSRLAWVPRRAGDRGAVDAGLLPTVLPGGRSVLDPEARADLAAAWGTGSVPGTIGRDTTTIFEAVSARVVRGLVLGGVEVADLPDAARARQALASADFVVSLEVRHGEVSEYADVVLPVAPAVEKPGTFVTWEGRRRGFDAVLDEPSSLTDTRVLAGIAEEMGTPLGFRTIAGAREDLDALGTWDGERAPFEPVAEPSRRTGVVLSTWRQLIDDGRGQDGQPEYRATARPAVALANAATLAAVGVAAGELLTVSGPLGAVGLVVEEAELPDDVVWLPGNNGTNLAELGLHHGSAVTLLRGGTDE